MREVVQTVASGGQLQRQSDGAMLETLAFGGRLQRPVK
jgi:hypothetical protein